MIVRLIIAAIVRAIDLFKVVVVRNGSFLLADGMSEVLEPS